MNNIDNSIRADVLSQSLPYIQQYNNKIIVIKYGGHAMVDDYIKQHVMEDIALLRLVGIKVVLVHGGGPEINDMTKRLGIEPQFVNGLRVTDRETANVVQMVLGGKVNKGLVNILESLGAKAIGICGIDGSLIKAQKINDELGFVGEITEINEKIILDLLDKDYIPVIATLGSDDDSCTYNINADTAAAKIAEKLGAEVLISMTDIKGLMLDKNDEDSLISVVTPKEVEKLIDDGIISDGMIPKVECCVGAINNGVKKVFIIDGRIKHSILIEVLTDEGMGTMFVKE
ncbi:MAG: acetylglutamate kinase [Clostridia bacterium]|nr:acetylglutamate kinase [Clostridia bacterium]